MHPIPKFELPTGMLAGLAPAVGGCATRAKLSVSDGMGADPGRPEPNTALARTVRVAKAVGWPDGV